MDAERFDTLARSLTDARSRRGVLVSLLGGTLGLLGLADTTARNKKGKSKNTRGCLPCKRQKKGKCTGRLPDGSGCPDGTCQNGSCVAAALPPSPPPVTCQPNQRPCRGGCIPISDCCIATDCFPGTQCSGPAACDVTGSCIYGSQTTNRTPCTDASPAGTCTGATPCSCRSGVCTLCPTACSIHEDCCGTEQCIGLICGQL